jgi:DNA polymerase III epsilon subunit-like protein
MKDIHALMVSTIATGPAVMWADIRLQSRLQHVFLIVLDSLSLDLFLEASISGCMPFLSEHFQYAASKAPGNAKRVFDGMSVLLRHPISKGVMKALKKELDTNLATLSTSKSGSLDGNMDVISETLNSSLNSHQTVVIPIICPATSREELQQRYSSSKNLASKSLFFEKSELTPGQLLLTAKELEANQYPLPHTITEEGFVEIAKYKEPDAPSAEHPKYHLLAIDCEMCRTSSGLELTRVVIVNMDLEIVYDSYVKPVAPITDYLTRWSGITEKILEPVSVCLSDIQNDLLEMISPKTILIGHSLENDLKALKISHHRVVDTALLYPHTRGETFKNSLKFLAENWLNESIQLDHGHDPTQDAMTAMKLALLKFRNGANFGRFPLNDKEENFCEYLYRQGKRTCIVDNAHTCKNYAGSHTDLHGEESDEMVTNKAQKAFSSCLYEFAFARLRSLEKYYASLEKTTDKATTTTTNTTTQIENQTSEMENGTVPILEAPMPISSSIDNPIEPISREVEKRICTQLDQQLRQMMVNIPKRSLVIVTGGHGNLARVRTINNLRNRTQNSGTVWSEADDAKSRAAFEKARETVVFFHIPTTPSESTSNDTTKETNVMDVSSAPSS